MHLLGGFVCAHTLNHKCIALFYFPSCVTILERLSDEIMAAEGGGVRGARGGKYSSTLDPVSQRLYTYTRFSPDH